MNWPIIRCPESSGQIRLACLLTTRNQRILRTWDTRQAENTRRAAAGLPPKTRRRRRTTLASLATSPP